MKKIYVVPFVLAMLVGTGFSSCNSFLDVRPTGTLEEAVQFSDVQGFRDAMYGVYGSMAAGDLYGDALGFGFADRLGQMFGKNVAGNVDLKASEYNYEDSEVRSKIDNIWTKQYEAIARVNKVIVEAEATRLTHSDIQLIKGEAYGVRAFLHFDIIRLFTPKYTEAKATERGIPYATTFDLKNKPVLNLQDSYQAVLNDLDKAEELLANDTNVALEEVPTNDYKQGRVVMFNLYAVYATKARVYYAMGNATKAAEYAQKVVDASNFALTTSERFEEVKTFPAGKELIFGLHNQKLSDTYVNYFLTSTSAAQFAQGRVDLSTLYDISSFSVTNTDQRYSAFYRQNGTTYSFIRFLSSAEEATNADTRIQGVNLIRLPEVYYILSESLYDTNKTEAIRLLNLVRASRGLEEIDDSKTDTKEHFEQEMIQERMREMPGEGQVFFALKYYNRQFKNFLNNKTIEPSDKVFVLPWPETELEYGNK